MNATYTAGNPLAEPPTMATLTVVRPKAYVQSSDCITASSYPFHGAVGNPVTSGTADLSNDCQSVLVHYTSAADGSEKSVLIRYNSVTVLNNNVNAVLTLSTSVNDALADAVDGSIYVIPLLSPIRTGNGRDLQLSVPMDDVLLNLDSSTATGSRNGLKYNCPFYKGQSITVFGGNRINTYKILGITMTARVADAALLSANADRAVDNYTISLDTTSTWVKYDTTGIANGIFSCFLSYPLYVDYAWELTKAELVLCGVNSPKKQEVKSKLALCDKYYKTLELEQYTVANPAPFFRRNFEIRGNILGTYLLTPKSDSLISTVSSNVASHRININALPTTNRDVPFGVLGTNSIYVDKLQQTLNNSGIVLKRVQNFNDTTDMQEQQDKDKQIAVYGQVINHVEVMDPAKQGDIKQIEYQINSVNNGNIDTPVYYLFKHTVKAF